MDGSTLPGSGNTNSEIVDSTQSPYQEFDRLCGRFVSEFGMESFPNHATIDTFLPEGAKDPERYAQSSTMDFHNKAAGHERRLASYLTENLQYTFKPFEQYIYATQLLQAECLGTAYRLFRRQWKGPGKEYCAGALCWQLNDCWPGISWSIIDYHLRPKLGYYAVKRELAPITVNAKRIPSLDANDPKASIEIWASNLTLEDRKAEFTLKMWDIPTGRQIYPCHTLGPFTLNSNRSTELEKVPVAACHTNGVDSARIVVAINLINAGDREKIARTTNWPEPLKYVGFQQPKKFDIRIVKGAVEVSAEVPLKAVWLDVPDEEGRQRVVWYDNGFDVMPGEVVLVGVKGLDIGEEERIQVRYMGSQGECLP